MRNYSISRRDFISVAGVGVGGLALYGFLGGQSGIPPLRPPGSGAEEEFSSACLRCQECIRSCPTQCLEPAGKEYGYGKVWTPKLNPELAKCEYELCERACALACPAGLMELMPDDDVRIGQVVLNVELCIVWKDAKDCLICYERCRYGAIEADSKRRPHIVTENCTGCGACQNSCIAEPEKAIIVYPSGFMPDREDRKPKRKKGSDGF